MEEIIEQVGANCGAHIEAYSKCVDLNPQNWKTSCISLEKELSKCSEKYSKRLLEAKQKCSDFTAKYEACLSQNQLVPEKCILELKDLYNCTNEALKTKPAAQN
ncbi:hypothetical protein BB561_001191 [Smittium simulii]|uniref:IMS import disulfide relay-system CHCH-CHCH-like Cx9C domain-containing protein n=1 Tax=Smittium simulii TaxID=133385 RepID=A0A2T9YVU9_9FUNG|nr:hypothetical protein BB561_001191 [Smittium simulii]